MLSMAEKWKQALVDNGKVAGVTFVDFQKAFDSYLPQKNFQCNYMQVESQVTYINGS